MGIRHLLECLRSGSGDARQRQLFRSTAQRCHSVPDRGTKRLRQRSNDPDLVTSKLAPLHFYQLGLAAPKPPSGRFNAEAAERGKQVFEGQAKCATCHVSPLFTEPGWNMHTPAEIGIDDFQANRGPDKRYRTSPLKGLWTHTRGGFYHDGRFATLGDVVAHYNQFFNLNLSEQQQADLVQYLQSL